MATLFAGSSRFSTDFSQVIDRTVAIASLPLKLLQQQKTRLDEQTVAFAALNGKAGALQSSVEALQNVFGSSSFGVSVSNDAAVSAKTTDAAVPGSWTVDVASMGSATTYIMTGFPATADPSTGNYITGGVQTILLGAELITLQPAAQNLRAVVDEINKTAGSKVQASIVNVGTTTTPNYQLSLQSRMLGATDITFSDDALQSTNSNGQRGALASYSVNGTTIATDSRTVTLSPGVTIDLKATTTASVSVTVSRSTLALSQALTNFAAAYNATNAEVLTHRGNKNAALSGNSVLYSLSESMRGLVSASSPSSGLRSLSDLGIGFNSSGELYLDQAVFASATAGKMDQVKTFIGTKDGSGLLSKLSGVMTSLTKTETGLLSTAILTSEASSKLEAQHILEQQERIDRLQTDLEMRMAAADALIASLEQQVTFFT
ncbi:MAG: flagellar filament capping protein FliD, partial [Bryobacteraceae bacterium]|nr:flagellar filament capping protein FliD [Bryobacteraceae bacterium]